MYQNLKKSFCNIEVNGIDTSSDSILFNSRTGLMLKISKDLSEAINNEEFDSIPKELVDKLKKMKAIVSVEENELETILNENKIHIAEKTSLYQVIMPSGGCQLGCYYCGQTHNKKELSQDMNHQIIKRIDEKLTKGNYKILNIGWFGGEPLMALQQIRFLTKELKKIAVKHNVEYNSNMTSNGLSLKPKIFQELVNDLAVRSIEVTLDGTKEYHDKHRYLKDGGASFDHIMNNLTNVFALENYHNYKCRISIRCNLDNDNYDSFVPLLDYLKEKNLQEKIAFIYPVGIYSWGNDAHLNTPDKSIQAKKELIWYSEMFKRGFWIRKMIPTRKKEVCLSVNPDYDVYDANGDVWNCTETPYVENYENSSYKIGNLLDKEAFNPKNVITDWNNELKGKDYWCNSCPVLPICGGRCPKSWIEGIPACPTYKYNMKDRILGTYYLNSKKSFSKQDEIKFDSAHTNNKFIQELKEVQ